MDSCKVGGVLTVGTDLLHMVSKTEVLGHDVGVFECQPLCNQVMW